MNGKRAKIHRGKLLGGGYLREIGYDGDGKAVMIITPTYLRSTPEVQFCIAQRDAWLYSEEHNPMFQHAMFFLCNQIFKYYSLGLVTAQKMAVLAGVIQEGIDDLINATPPPARSNKVVGEAVVTIGGKKVTRDLAASDLPRQKTEEVVGVIGQ